MSTESEGKYTNDPNSGSIVTEPRCKEKKTKTSQDAPDTLFSQIGGQKAFTVNKRKLREGTLPSYFAIAAAHKARTRKLESAIPESTAKNAVRS